MAHHYSNSLYDRLADRLNQFPQGAPLSDSLFAILKILFSEKEAGLVAQLPIKPFTVDRAAAIWKLDKATAQNMLEDLAGRAMLLDMEQNGQQMFCLPPPMAGFFEFSMMRVRKDVDQKTLAELFNQYINVEEDFMRELFVTGDTGLGRVFVQEPTVKEPYAMEILDWERATHVIETASQCGISMCYCRHKKQHLGTAWPTALLGILLGDAGMAASGSLLGALSVGRGGRESLLSIVLFPLLVPMLLAGVRLVSMGIDPDPVLDDTMRWIGLAAAFDGLFLGAGLLLFPFVYSGDD